MVDISGYDVILDMDELTAYRVVSDCDLRRVIIPDTVLKFVRLHMCVEFRDEILLRGGECETPENSNFRKMVKR